MSRNYCRNLPIELLISIFNHVEPAEDLLQLAVSSRLFNEISLKHYFSKNEFDPFTKIFAFNSLDGSLRSLPGLAISLEIVGLSIESLSFEVTYTIDPDLLMRDIHLLTRFVANLSSIERVFLRLTTFVPGYKFASWKRANIILLNTVMKKRCRRIHITTCQISSFHEEEPKKMGSSKPSEWLKNYWPQGQQPQVDLPKNLRYCYIQTFPSTLRPFFYHTLKCNEAVITDLCFKNVLGGAADWAIMLSNLHLPSLIRLAIVFSMIPRDSLIKFLSKHPTIATFEYHRIRYDPHPKLSARIQRNVFKELRTLITSPAHILKFLPPMAKMPILSHIVIKIEEIATNISALDGALGALCSCVNSITLSLEVTTTGLGFGTWFNGMFVGKSNMSNRPESRLSCVETLILNNGYWGFSSSNLVNPLLSWLRLFPALKVLTLRDNGPAILGLSEGSNKPLVIAAIKEACPGLFVEWCRSDSLGT